MQANQEEKNIVDNTKNEEETIAEQHSTEGLPDAERQEETQLAKLELEVLEAKDKYLRLYSEFDNYKKRVNRDRLDLIKSAGQEIMISILPTLDDLERAMKAMSEAKDVEPIKEGIQLVYQKMKSITEGKGLKAMESIGKDFDSDLHDAITNMPSPSEGMKGKVVDEIEKGYYLNGKVIRHAKVIVGN